VTEGNPYTGIDPAKNISIDVEVAKSSKPVRFAEPELLKLLDEAAKESAAEAEAAFRQRFGLEASAPLNSKLRKSLARFQQQFAESRMWDKVGQRVRASADGVGEVVLQEGSRFSRSGSGKFAVVTDATRSRSRAAWKRSCSACPARASPRSLRCSRRPRRSPSERSGPDAYAACFATVAAS